MAGQIQTHSATFILGATNLWEGPAAGEDSVILVANPVTAAWTAANTNSWIHLMNSNSAGSAAVVFSFDANPGATRSASLTIGGQPFTLAQAGVSYIPAPEPATALVSSNLAGPRGVAVDAAGNVYIADRDNSAIKKWTVTNNTVTTLVSTGLSGPYSLAVDAAGNVYIADSGNTAVKKWTAANNTVTTLVGTGLTWPIGVAVDGGGNVYIADGTANVIKKWIAATNCAKSFVTRAGG